MKKILLFLIMLFAMSGIVEAKNMSARSYEFKSRTTFEDTVKMDSWVYLNSKVFINGVEYSFGDSANFLFTDATTVTVGPTASDYTNINDAIDYLQKNYYPIYRNNADFTAKIVLQSDFIMDEQVLINGIDLGWIEIHGSSANSAVSLTSVDTGTVFGLIDTTTYYYAKFNAPGHTFVAGDKVFIKDHKGYLEEQYYNGLWTIETVGTDWFECVDVFMDSIRAGAGGTGEVVEFVTIPVKRSAMTANFEHFYYPAFGVARGVLPTIACIFEMDESANAYAGSESYIDGLCATDGGEINLLPYSGFRKADGSNIYATRSSRVNANDAIADSAGRHGIWAYSNSIINARRAYVANCGWNDIAVDRGDGWLASREPSGSGIVSSRGALVNAEGATSINNLGHCVAANYGGTINIGNPDEYGIIVGGAINGYNICSQPGGIITGVNSFGRGSEIDGNQDYYDFANYPGNNILLSGNKACGYFGEVTTDELFGAGTTATDLQTALGITQGTAINAEEPWFKFMWQGKILYYPKKPIRHSISWDHIYQKGCVYGTGTNMSLAERTMLDDGEASDGSVYKMWLVTQVGDSSVAQSAQVTINGKQFCVRLMRGTGANLPAGTYGRDDAVGKTNEWNKLILPLYQQTLAYQWSQVVDGNSDYSAYVNTTTPDWKTYYTDEDLVTSYSYGSGSYTWMQEFTPSDARRRVSRGNYGASSLIANSSWITSANLGLRLVLEEL